MKEPTSRGSFAAALRAVRLARRVAQDEMQPGASRAYMNLLATGRRSPTLDMIEALARRLDVHPATLVLLTYSSPTKRSRRNAALDVVTREVTAFLSKSELWSLDRLPRRQGKRAPVRRA